MEENKPIDVDYEEIPERNITGDPLFFTTTQCADLIGVEPSTVRYWTKRFEHLLDIEVSNRNKQYKKSDIEKLKFIKKLAYDDGLTLQQIDNYCSEKGFDLKNIENAVLDANNPLAVQTFIRATLVEMDKKLEEFSKSMMSNMDSNYQHYLDLQQQLNDNLQQNIVTTVDEVVSERLESKLSEIKTSIDEIEMKARERDLERIDYLKKSMEEQKRLNEQKSRGLFSRWFKK